MPFISAVLRTSLHGDRGVLSHPYITGSRAEKDILITALSSGRKIFPRGLQALSLTSHWPALGHLPIPNQTWQRGMVLWFLGGSGSLVHEAKQNLGLLARRREPQCHRKEQQILSHSPGTSLVKDRELK